MIIHSYTASTSSTTAILDIILLRQNTMTDPNTKLLIRTYYTATLSSSEESYQRRSKIKIGVDGMF